MLFLFLALFAVAAPLQDAAAQGAVRGEVRSGAGGGPIAGAVVEVRGEHRTWSAEVDRFGRYAIRGLPAGRRQLSARALGHAPFEVGVVIPGEGEIVLDLVLEVRPVPLRPLSVSTRAPRPRGDTAVAAPPELGMAGVRALGATPGIVEIGLGEIAPHPPGQEPADPSDILYVRGAASDQKLVLLDGAPVYSPFHLGGLLPPLLPETFHSVRLYLGGAPARYDGGLAYVMDLRTRSGQTDAFRAAGSADMLLAQARVEGPLGPRASFLAAGRTIHGLGIRPMTDGAFPYGYTDGLLRVDARLPGHGTLSATGFANQESVRLDRGDAGEARPGWANRAASLRYRGVLGGADAELTAAGGEFDASLPLQGSRSLSAHGRVRRTRFAADLSRYTGPLHLAYGAVLDRQQLRHRAWSHAGTTDTLLFASETTSTVLGAYADAGWQFAPRFRFRGGVRADFFSREGTIGLAPRAALTWMLGDQAALTLAAGRYHQYVRASHVLITPTTSGHSRPDSVPIPSALSVARASHLALSLDQELGEGVKLGLEAFFKSFENVSTAAAGAHASGVDVWVRRSAGRVTGWLGYSLAWVWVDAATSAGSEVFGGRQVLNSGLSAPLGPRGRLDLRVAYSAGLPFAAISFPSAMSNDFAPQSGRAEIYTSSGDTPPLAAPPDRPYLRVDLEASHTWSSTWSGVRFDATPYLRIINALDRRDALFYWYEPQEDAAPHPLASLPLLPMIGVKWRF